MKNRLLTLAGTLALLAVLGKFYARPVLAQVRAALVQDIDNPARHPYQQLALGTCNQGGCNFTFPAVPAGKRLVIQHITVEVVPYLLVAIVDKFYLEAASEPVDPQRSRSSVSFRFAMTQAAAPGVFEGNVFLGNAALVAYFEAGDAPLVRTRNTDNGSAADNAQATLSGYLVDLP